MAIDEKKLIEDLTEWFSGKVTYCLEHGYDDLREDIEDCFDAFTDIIEAQPKLDVPDTNVGKWIPCCERLPDEPEEYPDYGHRFSESVLCSVSHPLHDDCVIESFTMDGEWLCEKGTMLKVIAWMPLPPAYQGE